MHCPFLKNYLLSSLNHATCMHTYMYDEDGYTDFLEKDIMQNM